MVAAKERFRNPPCPTQLGSTGASGHRGGSLAQRAQHVTSWNKLRGKGHYLVPWLLDARVLPTLGGGDDGGRHPITI